jgi:hypothetical protein
MADPAEVTPRIEIPAPVDTTLPAPPKTEPGNGAAASVPPKPGETKAPETIQAAITETPRVKPKPDVVDYKELWKPLPIAQIIMADYDYIVFLSMDSFLDWQTMPSIDAAVAKLPLADVSAVHNRATEVFAIPKEHLTNDQQLNIRKMVGEGYARLFNLDPKSALQMINAAGTYAAARNQEIARGWQLKGTGLAAAAFCGAGAIAWLARNGLRSGLGSMAFILLLCVCAGALGAFFSVLTRMGTNSLDPSAGERLHLLEGGSRVVAGGVGALFAALAVHLSLVLGVLTPLGFPALIFISLIAGASERLVPTIIKNTETDAASSGKGNATT